MRVVVGYLVRLCNPSVIVNKDAFQPIPGMIIRIHVVIWSFAALLETFGSAHSLTKG